MIRDVLPEDAVALCDIYNHYVLETTVTFEIEAVLREAMEARIRETTAAFPWLVHEETGQILGYAHAGAWKSRCAYRHSAETTVYVAPVATTRGIGTALYGELLLRLRDAGLHTLLAGIALPNEPSIRLHERFGFRKAAHLHEVGFKFGSWIDVGYWELLLQDMKPA